jgi:hypothetical protein
MIAACCGIAQVCCAWIIIVASDVDMITPGLVVAIISSTNVLVITCEVYVLTSTAGKTGIIGASILIVAAH